MVESKLVELVVAGSNPVGHPIVSQHAFWFTEFPEPNPAIKVPTLKPNDMGSGGTTSALLLSLITAK